MVDRRFDVCWKPVELRSPVDALTGAVTPDPHSLGVSPADEAALEWALCCADRWGGRVRVVSAGDERAEKVLRLAAAAGAAELVWVEADPAWASDEVAAALAPSLADADLVWCGDVSADRGSGAVPAFLAGRLGVAQALGVVGVRLGAPGTGTAHTGPGTADAGPGTADAGTGTARTGTGTADSLEQAGPVSLEVVRRLDAGRRERLAVRKGAVVSCEGGTARLRRAPLGSVVASRGASIEVRRPERAATRESAPSSPVEVVRTGPFRPRARVVPPPPGSSASERVRSLVGLDREQATARALRLAPEQAAIAILEALEAWGERP